MKWTRSTCAVLGAGAFTLLALSAGRAGAQEPGVLPNVKHGGSPNIKLLSHLPLGGYFAVADIEIEQDPARPYVYVSKMMNSPGGAGFDVVDVGDPANARVIYRFRLPEADLHQGFGGMDGKYFQYKGRTYYVQSFQFLQDGPDGDVGAIVVDVTGLPDVKKVKEVARILEPELPRGFHNIFAYKHSDGRVLLFATTGGPNANIYDLGKLIEGDANQGFVGSIPDPVGKDQRAFYHDFYVGYDTAHQRDLFYGAGGGGYFVFDVTDPAAPKQITSITGVSGVSWGHTFTPTPDGKYAVTETEYQYAPLRIFDLQPGLEGKKATISRPVGAWTADWQDLAHNHEVRWPYVFVSAYEDGLQVFNMIDPAHPKTVGWYYTCGCAHETGFGGQANFRGTSVMNGAFGVDVRNADGLIVLSDSNSGLWVFRMDGFTGWNGRDWGMPNISSAQEWKHGPAHQSAR